MTATVEIKADKPVIGRCGTIIGIVDEIVGDKILLAKNDPLSGGDQHSIPLLWVEFVDDSVHLVKTAEQLQLSWENDID